MTILFRFAPHREPGMSLQETAAAAFRHIQNTYNQDCGIPDAYLMECPDDDPAGFYEFVDGSSDPDAIRQAAQEWESGIIKEFRQALKGLYLKTPEDADGNPDLKHASSTALYRVKKAACAMDNDFYAFADSALLITKNEYFTTRMCDQELNHILNHPEDYVLLEVSPK